MNADFLYLQLDASVQLIKRQARSVATKIIQVKAVLGYTTVLWHSSFLDSQKKRSIVVTQKWESN